jgi:predicted alpha/beta-fold hydrolase
MSPGSAPSRDGLFRPHPWLAGGHRQTLLGYWRRRGLRFDRPAEDLVVDTADGARVLLRATWQPGLRRGRPALVLVHGLGGSDASAYVVSTGQLAWTRGWHVVRMNMRGSGDGEALCPLLYNAGLDTDLLAALHEVARHVDRVSVVGFSLGANLALLALGRRSRQLPAALRRVAAVSPPVDLARCADALERPDNRLYQHYFVRMLREAYRRRHRARPDLFPPGLEEGARTVREYDDRITARFGGYAGVEDYYARSSAGPHLRSIDRETLLLAAADDPMIPVESVTAWPIAAAVRREITATGGHVGFVAPSTAPGSFWAAQRVLEFLDA